MGKKTPFLYVIDSSTSRGIQGGKRPQTTPNRAGLRAISAHLVIWADNFVIPKAQNGARRAPNPLATEPEIRNLQFCFCFKLFLPFQTNPFMEFSCFCYNLAVKILPF
jgi:hypothetical protein